MQVARNFKIVPLAALAAFALAAALMLVAPLTARAAELDAANLLQGEYTVSASMMNASDASKISVADGALTKPIQITVDASHDYTATLDMVSITMMGATAYMQSLSYWDGAQYQPSTVLSTYDVTDSLGSNYPKQLSFPLVNKAAGDEDGYVKLQVDVPIIAAMSGGRAPSVQNVCLNIDWSTLVQTKVIETVSGSNENAENAETPNTTEAVTEVVLGKVTYAVSDSSAKVTGIAKGAKSVKVRSKVKIGGASYKVTSIAKKAAYKVKSLKKIALGKNLKSIGKKAFKGIAKKATFTCPKAKLAKYKKLVKKAGAPATVSFKAA